MMSRRSCITSLILSYSTLVSTAGSYTWFRLWIDRTAFLRGRRALPTQRSKAPSSCGGMGSVRIWFACRLNRAALLGGDASISQSPPLYPIKVATAETLPGDTGLGVHACALHVPLGPPSWPGGHRGPRKPTGENCHPQFQALVSDFILHDRGRHAIEPSRLPQLLGSLERVIRAERRSSGPLDPHLPGTSPTPNPSPDPDPDPDIASESDSDSLPDYI